MDGLEKARGQINEIDQEMATLFEQRMRAVEDVIAYKQANGLPVLDGSREREVLKRNGALIQNPALRDYYEDFLLQTMELSKQYQRCLAGRDKVAYPGVEGAYSYIAMKRLFPRATGVSCQTFQEVVRAVDSGEIPCGVIPFENSFTGEVGMTMDLLYQYDVHITDMYDMPVSHNLLAVPGAELTDIRQVYSHEQGLSQCKEYLDTLDVERVPYVNTALAAKFVSATGDKTKAAIASIETAGLYQLDVLVKEINTSADNTTRFVVISKELSSWGNRFILLFTVDHDPGRLARVMQVIAKYGFNMESIRSRSVHNVPWQYYFYVEIAGDASSEQAREMLEKIRENCAELKLLGIFTKP